MSEGSPSMDDIAIEATVTLLETELEIGRDEIRENPADAISTYLTTLPDEGPIRGERATNIIKGLTHLIDEVDPDHPEHDELVDSIRDAVARSQ